MSKSKETVPAQQGDNKVGPGHPPKDHQFQPGQSGNPKGSPKPRTNLYRHVTKYAEMTDAELAEVDRDKLTQSEKAALVIVEKLAKGELTGSERMARYIVDREEGRAVERLILTDDNALTDDECNDIRELIRGNHAD
ncbi:DUF5681 domain-containing protein [Planctomycetota bacterium]